MQGSKIYGRASMGLIAAMVASTLTTLSACTDDAAGDGGAGGGGGVGSGSGGIGQLSKVSVDFSDVVEAGGFDTSNFIGGGIATAGSAQGITGTAIAISEGNTTTPRVLLAVLSPRVTGPLTCNIAEASDRCSVIYTQGNGIAAASSGTITVSAVSGTEMAITIRGAFTGTTGGHFTLSASGTIQNHQL
jgi:hypothetical protein